MGLIAAFPLSGVVTGVDSSSSISIKSLVGLISSTVQSTIGCNEGIILCNRFIYLLNDLIWAKLKSPDLDYCLYSLYIAKDHHNLKCK